MTGQYSHINGATTLNGRLPENKQYLAHEMKKVDIKPLLLVNGIYMIYPLHLITIKFFPDRVNILIPSFLKLE